MPSYSWECISSFSATYAKAFLLEKTTTESWRLDKTSKITQPNCPPTKVGQDLQDHPVQLPTYHRYFPTKLYLCTKSLPKVSSLKNAANKREASGKAETNKQTKRPNSLLQEGDICTFSKSTNAELLAYFMLGQDLSLTNPSSKR